MNNLVSATTNEAMMITPLSVANPCINICRMDLAGKYCQGAAGRWWRSASGTR